MQTRSSELKRWTLAALLVAATGFGVFVLPYFFSPPPLQGMSSANLAGFNNKVASIAAAFFSVLVFLAALRRKPMPTQPVAGDYRPLSTRFIAIATVLAAAPVAIFCRLITTAHFRYTGDTFYYLHQVSMYADYGRRLYDQIEFPYGPLLFYSPVALHALLKPFGVSLLGALLTTLVLQHIVGLLLVAWAINSMHMLHRWRVLLLVVAAIHLFQPNFAPNYTFFRFFTAAACTIFLARQKTVWRYAAVVFLAQILCLAISPEMGFAFFFSASALTLWRIFAEGRSWLPCLAAPVLAIPAFLLVAGGAYVRMLALFSRGIMNFVVEPQPHILIFLFALVWLVPTLLALHIRQRQPDAPLLGALYVFSLALLPVAFGRADAGHLYFNGTAIFLISFVAICYRAPWKQTLWAAVTTIVLLAGHAFNVARYGFEIKTTLHHNLFGPNSGLAGRAATALLRRFSPHTLERELYYASITDEDFDFDRLEQLTHGEAVSTPLDLDLGIEEKLTRRGQLTPSYSYYMIGITDRTAELRQVAELHQYNWVLVPNDKSRIWKDDPMSGRITLGLNLPWEKHRQPYVLGNLLYEDLNTNWIPVANINDNILYKRK